MIYLHHIAANWRQGMQLELLFQFPQPIIVPLRHIIPLPSCLIIPIKREMILPSVL